MAVSGARFLIQRMEEPPEFSSNNAALSVGFIPSKLMTDDCGGNRCRMTDISKGTSAKRGLWKRKASNTVHMCIDLPPVAVASSHVDAARRTSASARALLIDNTGDVMKYLWVCKR